MSRPEPPGNPFDFDSPQERIAPETRAMPAAGPRQPWMYWVGGGVSLVFCLALNGWTLTRFWKAQAIKSWPTTDAVVLVSEAKAPLLRRRATYSLTVRYQYMVGGDTYESTQIGSFGGEDGSLSSVEAVLSRYPPGATVSAFYNPDDPADAYLEAGVHSGHYSLLFISLVVTVVCVWSILSQVRARARLKANGGESVETVPPVEVRADATDCEGGEAVRSTGEMAFRAFAAGETCPRCGQRIPPQLVARPRMQRKAVSLLLLAVPLNAGWFWLVWELSKYVEPTTVEQFLLAAGFAFLPILVLVPVAWLMPRVYVLRCRHCGHREERRRRPRPLDTERTVENLRNLLRD